LKVFFNNIQTLLIVVLVAIILFTRSCSGGKTSVEPKIITKVETRWDTVNIVKEVYIPKWKTKIITQVDSILINTPVDTLEVLKDYYAKNVFVDEIKLDSLGIITITDTIYKNTIWRRAIESNILIPTTTVTEKIYINNREFYWGLNLIGKSNQIDYLGGGILYKSKRKNIYGLGIGVNENFQPILSIGYYMKIGNK
jgi:hypothetical protein|tara:strand:+ start:2021 stop:2611 length:591 start_codon:yes stop_codon:yes gene_type:complete